MAATVSSTGSSKEMWPYFVLEFDITGLVAGETVSITHGGPSQYRPDKVEVEPYTLPTAPGPINWSRDRTNDSTTVTALKFFPEPGGDLSGAVARVRLYWYGGKGGGISA